jgi:superfamily II DNA or RNA helicase
MSRIEEALQKLFDKYRVIEFCLLNPNDEQLRDYQLDKKRKIYKSWQRNRSVMLQMPTGTGKTRLFVSIVKDLHKWSVNNRQ